MTDILEYIKKMQEMYGDDVITTADKINRPDPKPIVKEIEAINEFVRRNPRADGGRIGFMSGLSARTQNLVSLYDLAELDLPIPEATIKQVFQTKDRAKAYKKIFKDNGIKIVATGKQRKALFKKPTQKQIDGVWKDTIKLVKEGKGTVPDKMRIPFKNEVVKIFDKFNQTGTPFSTSDIYYKLVENVQDNPRIFLPSKRKGGKKVPGEEIKRALGKEKADLLLDGNIQRIEKTIGNRKKLVEILSKGESDINTLAKTLNISKKDLFAEADILFDDVYRYNSAKVRKTGFGEKYGYLKDYEIKDFKNILNNLRASGFEKLDERSIRALITDAYAETSSKKYDVAMKKLSQYNKINNQLKQVFGFNFELDHPLSFQNLKNIGNVSPENLLRVTPIPKDINRIKIGLDGTYNNILSALRSGDTSPALLNQKKAIETIAKNLGIGEFKVSKTGDKILSFGAKPFLQADLIGGMKENVNLQNKIAENLKNIDPEELEIAFGKKSKIPASIKNLKPIDTKKMLNFLEKNLPSKNQQLIKNQFCPGNKKGGKPGSCPINEAMDNMVRQTNAVKQGTVKGAEAARIANKASKVARFGTGKGLAKVLGPYGLAAEAFLEVALAVPGYAKGKTGKRLLGDSIFGLIPGVGQSAEEEFTEYATKAGMSELEQQKIKDANRFLELNQSLIDAEKAGVLEGRGVGRGVQNRGLQNYMKLAKEYNPLYDQFVGAPPSQDVSAILAEQDRINQLIQADQAERAEKRNIALEEDFMAAEGGIASGPPPTGGPMSQGLRSLYNNGKKL